MPSMLVPVMTPTTRRILTLFTGMDVWCLDCQRTSSGKRSNPIFFPYLHVVFDLKMSPYALLKRRGGIKATMKRGKNPDLRPERLRSGVIQDSRPKTQDSS